jgi:hypothetical protein
LRLSLSRPQQFARMIELDPAVHAWLDLSSVQTLSSRTIVLGALGAPSQQIGAWRNASRNRPRYCSKPIFLSCRKKGDHAAVNPLGVDLNQTEPL